MKKITYKFCSESGLVSRKERDMRKLLNYNILNLLDYTHRSGPLDLPSISCNTTVFPDYLALYSQLSLYDKTDNVAVCFYSYDKEFDGKYGLYWAIYYNDKKRLNYFKNRFKNVKYFISPDYSMFGDIHTMENMYRLWKSRIVALWFILELRAVVIPSICYWNEESFSICNNGLENCSVVAMSAKGHTHQACESRLFKKAIKNAVDNLPLKIIIVYSACGKDENCLKLFDYAIKNGVQIIIPQNTLRERNMERRCLK